MKTLLIISLVSFGVTSFMKYLFVLDGSDHF